MREIKFRCYDKNEGFMLPWEHLIQAGDLPEMLQHGHEQDADYSKLMQYTGLKDKNGVEIYEGDILDYGKRSDYTLRFEVVFDHSGFSRKWISKETAKIRGLKIENLAYNTSSIFEVIGNIYEHPHLLEESQ